MLIRCLDHGLHHIDLRVIEECAQRGTDHRLAGDVAILLRSVAARALTSSGCDNDRSHLARHGTL